MEDALAITLRESLQSGTEKVFIGENSLGEFLNSNNLSAAILDRINGDRPDVNSAVSYLFVAYKKLAIKETIAPPGVLAELIR